MCILAHIWFSFIYKKDPEKNESNGLKWKWFLKIHLIPKSNSNCDSGWAIYTTEFVTLFDYILFMLKSQQDILHNAISKSFHNNCDPQVQALL